MRSITAVIFDWAGTTVDFGSLAPVRALQRLFAGRGIQVNEEEARRDMGIHKKDHIRELLALKTGCKASEAAVEEFFAEFIPMQMECLASFSALIPGVAESIEKLRGLGIRIGSTTGYTRPMLDVLLAHAGEEGYTPDCALCPDDTVAGRPWPWMCYLAAIQMKTYPMYTMIKIGDTTSDIDEGLNAGMWTVGVVRTGNMIGLNEGQLTALSPAEQAARASAGRRKLTDAGAHYAVDSVADFHPLLAQIEERLAKGERP